MRMSFFKAVTNFLKPAEDSVVEGVLDRIGGCNVGESSSNFYFMLKGYKGFFVVHVSQAKNEHLAMAQAGDKVRFTKSTKGHVRNFVNVTLEIRLA
jgi:hypothetical protein